MSKVTDSIADIARIDAIESSVPVVNNTLTSTSTTEALSAAQGKVLQDGKQNTLVSGTNIKTVNGQDIVGSGDMTVGELSHCTFIDTYVNTLERSANEIMNVGYMDHSAFTKINSTQILCTFREYVTGSYQLYSIVYNIDTHTYGTKTLLVTATETVQYTKVHKLADNKVIVFYQLATTAMGYCKILNTSGNTITVGTQQTFKDYSGIKQIITIGTTYIMSYTIVSALYMAPFTVSADVVTFTTNTAIGGTNIAFDKTILFDVSGSLCVVTYNTTYFTGNTYSISGLTLTKGTTAYASFTSPGVVHKTANGDVLVFGYDTSTTKMSCYKFVKTGTVASFSLIGETVALPMDLTGYYDFYNTSTGLSVYFAGLIGRQAVIVRMSYTSAGVFSTAKGSAYSYNTSSEFNIGGASHNGIYLHSGTSLDRYLIELNSSIEVVNKDRRNNLPTVDITINESVPFGAYKTTNQIKVSATEILVVNSGLDKVAQLNGKFLGLTPFKEFYGVDSIGIFKLDTNFFAVAKPGATIHIFGVTEYENTIY